MVFSSAIFIFLFLPLVLITNYFCKKIEHKNLALLLFSLVFYAWGEPIYIILLLLSIVLNWKFGCLVSESIHRSTWLKIAIVFNIGLLFVFKYLGFVCENINHLFGTKLSVNISLPIGISFFTFQALSYVIDVYRGNGEVQKKLRNVGLYIVLFPQLIAGPIVRYETIAKQINQRVVTIDNFSLGLKRFIAGLGKKVIFSNNFALIADMAFETNTSLSGEMAWLGAIAYSLQILFDFSGYSDMAIGLGKMFGFEFEENFNFPYISKSVTEFWRRWHISLGGWFRDYVYIPLGGNRVGKGRHIINLFVVWFLTGLWHGANWTFIVWGLLYFVLLVFEKLTHLNVFFEKKTHFISHVYTMFFVIIGWVIFRADNIGVAFSYIRSMFTPIHFTNTMFVQCIGEYGVLLLLSILFLIPCNFIRKLEGKNMLLMKNVIDIGYLVVFLISVSSIIKGSYSPFIYFNF